MQSDGSPDTGLGRLGNWHFSSHFGAGSPTGMQFFLALAFVVLIVAAFNLALVFEVLILEPVVAAMAMVVLCLALLTGGYLWLRRDEALVANASALASKKALQERAEKELARLQNEQRQLTRRYREEKLKAEAASRAKTAFLAHLSHDVRTPLNHIIGFADLLKHQAYGPIGDKRYLAYIEDIKRSGERLLFSFAEILELAELDAGKRVLQEEHIDVDELLTALQDQFQSSAAHCGVTFDISGARGVELRGDRACFLRMLANILDNSMRFTPSGGKVSLMVWEAENGVVLSVTDTGIGIPPERLKALSSPFALEDALVARGRGGMGLGLAISRTIAELSGGEMAIESTPAIGTTVAISLPRAAIKDDAVRPAA